jgi:hypothetical protein
MEYCGAKLSLQNDCSANYESVGMCLLRLYARALDGQQAEHEGNSTNSMSMPDINANPDISTMSIFPHRRTREPAASANRG